MTESHGGESEGEERPSSRSKVASLIREYDLHGLGDELVEYWTTESDERMSLRELADYFNEELVASALRQATVDTLDGEPANYYRLLADDDVSSGTQVQTENQLEQEGIDVEKLTEDFVSRQAIHTYVTKERGASYEANPALDQERLDNRIETINRLKNRLVAVTNRIIGELEGSGIVSAGDTRITALVRVQCQECENQYPITEFLANRGCDCRESRQ